MKKKITTYLPVNGRHTIAAVSLTVCLLLSGCSSQTQPAYENSRMEAMAEETWEHAQADPFAKDLCVVTGTEGEEDTSVTAEAAAVFGVNSKEVIFQKNPFERLYPASITKIMTALIAIRDGNLSDSVTVGQETVITETGASLAHINPGDTLTLEQLLYGLMLPSGNDAGAAIAVYLSGSTEAFAKKMNETAHALGATDTHFVNPHGLSNEDHYTTAYDLYLIFRKAIEYPEFRKIISTVSYQVEYTDSTGQPKIQEWKNSNQYLNGKSKAPEGVTVIGGKTGTTRAAGSCLILDCQDENANDYISVILKAENRDILYDNMTNIIGKIVN